MMIPIQTQVMGVLRSHAKGVTAATVAQALGMPRDQVGAVLETLYISSIVECRRLGESVYRLLPRN